ncbi:MAG: hypothetical protein ACYTKD_10240 [Planctomycetota bacterium]|jgi:hypothetical protein
MLRSRVWPAVPGLALAAALSAGCFPGSNLKTGVVTPPGRLAFGLGGVGTEGGIAPMIDLRLGLTPRWDIGMRYDYLSYDIETRIQPLADEVNHVDLALELGVGFGAHVIPKPLIYGGFAVSKKLGRMTPYFHFRYIDIKLVKTEVATDQGESQFIADLFFYVPEDMDEFPQYSVGFEYAPSEKFGFLAEVLVCPTLEDAAGHPLTFVNAGMRFRFW